MFEPERFIESCLATLKERSAQLAVQELVREAVSQPGAVEKALGTPAESGITTIFRSDELTILNVVWAPLMNIYPHDHRTWAVIGTTAGRKTTPSTDAARTAPGSTW